MNTTFKTVAVSAFTALVVVVVALFMVGGNSQSGSNLGATGTRFPNGVSANTTSPVTGELRGTTLTVDTTATFTGDVTFNGGLGGINIPTGASATSTLTVGNIQTYATSSATRICLVPSVTGATSTYAGTVYFTYGACL